MVEIVTNLSIGLHAVMTPGNLGWCLFGALVGTLIGVLPGIGPVPTMAILLPLTFGMAPLAAMIMLAGIYYGAQYGGSTTAILVNIPGETSTAITCLDGFPMAKQGRAGTALATAAIGSFIAGCLTTLGIAFFAPILGRFAVEFSPADTFSLFVFGLVSAVILAHGSILKAMAMVALGINLGFVGMDVSTGVARLTFGRLELIDGLSIVALAVGLFGIPEIITNLEGSISNRTVTAQLENIFPSLHDFRQALPAMLRGTAIGSFLGIIPGGGATLGSLASYMVEKKIARDPSRFGHGAIEGVAGPESANNAGAQAAFIPMLTLGIPTNVVLAVMVGALYIQGITRARRSC